MSAAPLPNGIATSDFQTNGSQTTRMNDEYGNVLEFSPDGEIRIVPTYKLAGATFNGNIIDPNYWIAVSGVSGSLVQSQSQLTLSTSTVANNAVSLQSKVTARFVSDQILICRSYIRCPDTGTANNVRRWGAFTSNDGAFFELTGSTFRIVTRKAGSDIQIPSGSFNGTISSFTIDTNAHIYEIYWDEEHVIYSIDGRLAHTVTALTASWTSQLGLPVRVENSNSANSTSNVSIQVNSAMISRLGQPQSQPISNFQNGTVTATLKYGPGNLHGLVIAGIVNNSVVTLYDGFSATGSILWTSGAMAANSVPFGLNFFNAPFSSGLTIGISGANANCTTIYE